MRNHTLQKGHTLLERKCLLLRLMALGLWATALLVLSLAPKLPHLSGPLGWDKLNHALAYFVLAFFLSRVLYQWSKEGSFIVCYVWILTVGFGGLLELIQFALGAGRTAEWLDLLANALGVSLFCVLLRHSRVRQMVQARDFSARK